METFYFMCQLVVKRRYGEFSCVLELEIIRVKVLKNPLMVRVIDSLMQDFDGFRCCNWIQLENEELNGGWCEPGCKIG